MVERAIRGELSRRELLRRTGTLGGMAVFDGSLASFLASCGAAATPTVGSGSAASGSPTTAVRRGGSLSWAYTLIPTKLDPVWSGSRTDGIVLAQMLEGLVRNSRESKIEAALADKWTISEDGLTYTFHLRSGVKFHNGKAVTPEDVIASLGRSKGNGTYKWTLAAVTSVTTPPDESGGFSGNAWPDGLR